MEQIRAVTRCPHVRIAQNQLARVSTRPRIRQSKLAPLPVPDSPVPAGADDNLERAKTPGVHRQVPV